MRKIKIEEAVGEKLAYDVTEVDVYKGFKGTAFTRGHIITHDDLDKFIKLGRQHVYIEDKNDIDLHENDVAEMIAPLAAGENIYFDKKAVEGKVSFYAKKRGVFKIDKERILAINRLEIPSFPVIHNNYPVNAGKSVAAFRIIPLTCTNSMFNKIKQFLEKPLFDVRPYKVQRISILVTGSEVYYEHKKDAFIPIIKNKLKELNIDKILSRIVPDDEKIIIASIKELLMESEVLIITGGTSVDPDDITRNAIVKSDIKLLRFGNPIQPGNNLSIGYLDDKVVCAVPAAALFYKSTSLDIFLPRIIARDKITKNDLADISIGGLCHFCDQCVFPVCPFGKY